MGKLTNQQRDEICKKYTAGERPASLARKFGVAGQSIHKLLKKRGVYNSCRSIIPISDEERVRMVKLYKKGISIDETSKIVGRSTAAVNNVIRKSGILLSKAEGKLRRIPSEIRDAAVALYQSGKTADEIAALNLHPKLTRNVVFNEIKRRGIPTHRAGSRGRFHDRSDDRAIIIEHYNSGFSSNFLSVKFECSRDAINKVLDNAGIKRRTHLESIGFRWFDSKNREHLMRSSWEICTAQWLDDQGVLWDYELESFILDDNGKRRRYTPDFWVYGPDGSIAQIIEVKGWTSKSCEHRMNLFRGSNPELPFEVWEETDLRQRGILDVVLRVLPKQIGFAGAPNQMSNKERLRAMDLFDKGMSYSNIAKEIKRGSSTVSSFLKSTGRIISGAASNMGRVSQEKRDQLAELYLAGDSITVVSKKSGLSRDIVWGEVKRRGISRSLSLAQKSAKANGRDRWSVTK